MTRAAPEPSQGRGEVKQARRSTNLLGSRGGPEPTERWVPAAFGTFRRAKSTPPAGKRPNKKGRARKLAPTICGDMRHDWIRSIVGVSLRTRPFMLLVLAVGFN